MPENGFFILYKPAGITSSQFVQKVKKKYQVKKIGHTGTLDKFAEGIMILPYGKFTAFSDLFLKSDKEYEAVASIGKSTDSGDSEGNSLEVLPLENLNTEDIQKKINKGLEEICSRNWQVPPKISALKINGSRQSDIFRKGGEIPEIPRDMKIYSWDILDWDHSQFRFKIKSSSGVYIRKIIIDLAELTELPMHLIRLVRTGIGKIDLGMASRIDDDSTPNSYTETLTGLEILIVTDGDLESIRHGRLPNLFLEEIQGGQFLIQDKDGRLAAWCRKTSAGMEFRKVFV